MLGEGDLALAGSGLGDVGRKLHPPSSHSPFVASARTQHAQGL